MSSRFTHKEDEHTIRCSDHNREYYFLRWRVEPSTPDTISVVEFRMSFPVDSNHNPLTVDISGDKGTRLSDFKRVRVLVKKRRRDIREFLKINGFEEFKSTLFKVWYERVLN